MRIFGFILLTTLGVANLTVRRRLPPKETGGMFNPVAFKNPAYTIYCAAGVVAFLGLYTRSHFLNSIHNRAYLPQC